MIDLHAHILPGVDDGARNIAAAVRMLKEAQKQEIRVIAATSHASPECEAAYQSAFDSLEAEAVKRGISLIPGMEYDIDRLPTGFRGLRTLGKTDLLLLDLKTANISSALPQLLFELGKADYQIVIVHPERIFFRNLDALLELLTPCDPYYQVNLGSLAGRYGPEVRGAAWHLLDSGNCHWIASDAHRSHHYRFLELRAMLKRYYDETIVDCWLKDNPQRLLDNRPLLAPRPAGLNWMQRWRRRREKVFS